MANVTLEEVDRQILERWKAQAGYDFDWEKYTTDQYYKSKVLQDLDKYFPGRGGHSTVIGAANRASRAEGNKPPEQISPEEVRGVFDQYREDIGALAEQRKISAKADINAASRGAQDRAIESLAGTGLGRSGVANTAVTGIATAQADATTRALNAIDEAKFKAGADSALKEALTNLDQKLISQQWDYESRRDALNFERQKALLQFQYDLQDDGTDWADWFSAIADVALGGSSLWLAYKHP